MGSLRVYAYASLCLALLPWLRPSAAKAGPLELFNAVAVSPTDSAKRVLPYYYGGAGMFISNDGGKSFGLLCSTAIDSTLFRSTGRLSTLMSGSGALLVGSTDGLWRGQPTGCGFARVPELDKRYIGALANDPIDPQRSYVTTSNNGQPNSLFVNDGKSPAFSAFGAQTDQFLNTLHVVKHGSGRRIYETGVKLQTEQNSVQYTVRVSDDDAASFTDNVFPMAQFGMVTRSSEFQLLQVDPKNPDAIVGRISRVDPGVADSLVYSADQGKTWTSLAEVTTLNAVAFAPDGALYFGDDDQNTPGLFVLHAIGDMPTRLSAAWKVGCLYYDASQTAMLACNDYTVGKVDLASGAFTPFLDMRCAQNFVECPDQPSIRDACETQELADFCNLSHYPIAPLCQSYDQGPGADAFKASIGYSCRDGLQVLGAAGSAGAPSAGTGGSAGAPSGGAAGSSGQPAASSGGAASGSPSKSSGGCSVSAGSSQGAGLALSVALCALGLLRRRRKTGH